MELLTMLDGSGDGRRTTTRMDAADPAAVDMLVCELIYSRRAPLPRLYTAGPTCPKSSRFFLLFSLPSHCLPYAWTWGLQPRYRRPRRPHNLEAPAADIGPSHVSHHHCSPSFSVGAASFRRIAMLLPGAHTRKLRPTNPLRPTHRQQLHTYELA